MNEVIPTTANTIGFTQFEINMMIAVTERLYTVHNLPEAQKHDFLDHLQGTLNGLTLSQTINTEVVTNYVRKICPICKKQFFGMTSDLHCRAKSCGDKWKEQHIFSRLRVAQENAKNLKNRGA